MLSLTPTLYRGGQALPEAPPGAGVPSLPAGRAGHQIHEHTVHKIWPVCEHVTGQGAPVRRRSGPLWEGLSQDAFLGRP